MMRTAMILALLILAIPPAFETPKSEACFIGRVLGVQRRQNRRAAGHSLFSGNFRVVPNG